MYMLLVLEKDKKYYDIILQDESLNAIENKLEEISNDKDLKKNYRKYRIAFIDWNNPKLDSDIKEGDF